VKFLLDVTINEGDLTDPFVVAEEILSELCDVSGIEAVFSFDGCEPTRDSILAHREKTSGPALPIES
jgi:hypothetical protein